MKMYKNMAVQIQAIDGIFCNMCGHEIPKDKFNEFADYLEIEKVWGYNSPYDGECHSFDLCLSCYEKILNNFKIPVT